MKYLSQKIAAILFLISIFGAPHFAFAAFTFGSAGNGTTAGVTLTVPAGNNIEVCGVDNGNGTGTGKPTQMKVGISAMTDANLTATVGGQTMWLFYLVGAPTGSQTAVDGSGSASYEYACGTYTSNVGVISIDGTATAQGTGNQTLSPSPTPSGDEIIVGDGSTSSGVVSAGTNATKQNTGAPAIFDTTGAGGGTTSMTINTTTNIFATALVLKDQTTVVSKVMPFWHVF